MFLGKTVPHRALADPRSFFLGTKLLLSLRTFHHFYPLVSGLLIKSSRLEIFYKDIGIN